MFPPEAGVIPSTVRTAKAAAIIRCAAKSPLRRGPLRGRIQGSAGAGTSLTLEDVRITNTGSPRNSGKNRLFRKIYCRSLGIHV